MEHVIHHEFKAIFQAKQARTDERLRAQRRGRIDTRRSASVVNGNSRIFSQRSAATKSGVAGSLAIVTTLLDLRDSEWFPDDPQVKAWKDTISALFTAARELNIPVQIFAGMWSNKTPSYVLDLRQYDNLEDFFKDKGTNGWTRQAETIQMAEQWHKEVNAQGNRVTLLVTAWPEMRDVESNKDRKLYEKALDETGRMTRQWTKNSSFYAMGIMLEKTCAKTWGHYKSYGVHNHFRTCFPSARRSFIEAQQDIPHALKRLAQNMAHLS